MNNVPNVPNVPKKVGNTKPSSSHDTPRIKWCFTLNNWSKEELCAILKFFRDSCNFSIMGEEIGEQGTKHLQGYFEIKTKKRLGWIKNNVNTRLHLEKAKGNKQQNIEYCSKEGGNIYIDGRLKRTPNVLTYDKLYDWQKEVADICDDQDSFDKYERSIFWYWDEAGNKGKTALAKYLVKNHGAIAMNGKASDCKCAIAKMVEEKGQGPDVVCFTIPRDKEGYVSYSVLEEIKDGLIFSGKYESKSLLIASPLIFVFANFHPDENKCSKDRWIIKNLGN